MSTDSEEPLPTLNAGTQLFQDLDATNASATEIESLCMQCHQNGQTKLMLTKIPHFKSIIIMSFECPHCGFKNNEIQSGEAIQEKGHLYQLVCKTQRDLDRQVVRNSTASVSFPEWEFAAPPSKTSTLTTVEGLISHFIEDLASDQEERREKVPGVYQAIEGLLEKLRGALNNQHEFTIVVDDPSGNSYMENLCAPSPDPQLTVRHYPRTHDQMVQLGMVSQDNVQDSVKDKPKYNAREEAKASEEVVRAVKEASESKEILSFPANCSSCNGPCDTRMQMIDIPHFQEVIIMSTTCDSCGYKSNEVKCGGAISPQGKRITLRLEDQDDLSRDILKSETSSFKIPELDLDMLAGTLGGRFTTIEGLLRQVHEELDRRAPFMEGDSVAMEKREKFKAFLDRLLGAADGQVFPLTLVLDDPMSHSYIQNIYAPDPDPNMTSEDYDRSFEQNEDLGLNDINV